MPEDPVGRLGVMAQGQTFWGLTTIPGSTRRCEPRTFGSSST